MGSLVVICLLLFSLVVCEVTLFFNCLNLRKMLAQVFYTSLASCLAVSHGEAHIKQAADWEAV